jgi:hypothetical protein
LKTVRREPDFFVRLTDVNDNDIGAPDYRVDRKAQPRRGGSFLAIHETSGNGGDKWFRYGGSWQLLLEAASQAFCS